MKTPNYNLVIERGDSRDLQFRPKPSVDTDAALDWTGSTAVLVLYDALGEVLFQRETGPVDGAFTIAISLEERAALPALVTGRYELLRRIGDSQEVFLRGSLSIVGAAGG